MFSLQELMTAVEQRLDLTVIVVDNGGYAEIKQNEADAGIAPIAVDLAQPDWPALAAAFGGTGHRARTSAELAEAVAAAGERGGLHLIHLVQSDFTA
jgi:acetolactate synthase-1/2/3 large subunit